MDYFVKAPDGTVFGPADLARLRTWADESRVMPDYLVSTDGKKWRPITSLAELDMNYLVEMHPGEVFGPFTRKVVDELVAKGEMPKSAQIYVRESLYVAVQRDLAKAQAEIESMKNTIVIDPEVLDPEPAKTQRIDAEPPRVEPLGNMATLEQRLRSELLRARERGVDFSFLRKKR